MIKIVQPNGKVVKFGEYAKTNILPEPKTP
jgi:hypothetical protein